MRRRRKNVTIIHNEIDYDKLAEAIVRAKRLEEESAAEGKTAELEEWQKSLGVNNHEDKKGLVKKIFCVCNRLKVIWKMMFISKRKHIATSPTSAFLQGLVAAFFVLIQWLLTMFALCFLVTIAYHPNHPFGIGEYVICISLALLSFMLSRIFRLIAIEIEQMSDREKILGVFTAIVTVISLVDKIVDLLLKG